MAQPFICQFARCDQKLQPSAVVPAPAPAPDPVAAAVAVASDLCALTTKPQIAT